MTPDTSAEAVARLRRLLAHPDDVWRAHADEAADMLAALAAERDQEKSDREEWMRQHGYMDERCAKAEAERDAAIRERDAARAEAERMRRLWTYMQKAAADPGADEPMTAAKWLAEFADADAKTRATLTAKEPGHE